jgi:hypothetical protein
MAMPFLLFSITAAESFIAVNVKFNILVHNIWDD